MRITENFLVRQNLFSTASFNKTKLNEAQTMTLNNSKDESVISPLGSAINLIENLTKQKQEIIQRKNELVANTIDSGGNMQDIEL